jgi:hypothetical protein
VKKTSEERSMTEHNFTVLRKNRTGKALCKGVDNHEVGPKRNKLHNTSSIKLEAKMNADVNVARRFRGTGLVDMVMQADVVKRVRRTRNIDAGVGSVAS